MYKEYLKKRILECRIGAKMSKKQFAATLNISLPTYYKYEKTGNCTLEEFIRMCEVFNLHIQIIPKQYL